MSSKVSKVQNSGSATTESTALTIEEKNAKMLAVTGDLDLLIEAAGAVDFASTMAQFNVETALRAAGHKSAVALALYSNHLREKFDANSREVLADPAAWTPVTTTDTAGVTTTTYARKKWTPYRDIVASRLGTSGTGIDNYAKYLSLPYVRDIVVATNTAGWGAICYDLAKHACIPTGRAKDGKPVAMRVADEKDFRDLLTVAQKHPNASTDEIKALWAKALYDAWEAVNARAIPDAKASVLEADQAVNAAIVAVTEAMASEDIAAVERAITAKLEAEKERETARETLAQLEAAEQIEQETAKAKQEAAEREKLEAAEAAKVARAAINLAENADTTGFGVRYYMLPYMIQELKGRRAAFVRGHWGEHVCKLLQLPEGAPMPDTVSTAIAERADDACSKIWLSSKDGAEMLKLEAELDALDTEHMDALEHTQDEPKDEPTEPVVTA